MAYFTNINYRKKLQLNKDFLDKEKLFRAIKINPVFWKDDLNKPSSALFKDSKGISVDREFQRDINNVVLFIEDKFGRENFKGVVSLFVETCKSKNLFVKYDPLKDNQYHSLILKSEQEIELTAGQSKYLSNSCKIEKMYQR